MPRVTLDKKYRTRSGWAAKIYAIDIAQRNSLITVHGAVKQPSSGDWLIHSWTSDGFSQVLGGPNPMDLFEVPYKVRRVLEYEGPKEWVEGYLASCYPNPGKEWLNAEGNHIIREISREVIDGN